MKNLRLWIAAFALLTLSMATLAKTTPDHPKVPETLPPLPDTKPSKPLPPPAPKSRWDRQDIIRKFYALIEQAKTDPKAARKEYAAFRKKLLAQKYTTKDRPFSRNVPDMLSLLKWVLRSTKPASIAQAATEEQAKAIAEKNAKTERAKTIFLLTPSDDVIYVIDRSGSMIDTFEEVKVGLLKSLGSLLTPKPIASGAGKRFGVILFAQNKPQTIEGGKLLELTDRNFLQTIGFLDNVIPVGQTDPLPALKLAFDTHFAALDKTKLRIQQIVLLTDGCFPDNSAVLKLVEAECKRNPAVNVCTILYGYIDGMKSERMRKAAAVMKKITSYSVGTYRYVERSDD